MRAFLFDYNQESTEETPLLLIANGRRQGRAGDLLLPKCDRQHAP